jgi:hypothetical protein
MMLKWLFRIGLGFLVAKLAEEYTQPARRKSDKRTASRPAAKPRKNA